MSGGAAAHVVVLSGSVHAGSRTERLARWSGDELTRRGARTTMFRGAELEFPFYRPAGVRSEQVDRYLSALRSSNGVVLISPAYHGTLSGLLKNALDYVNELGDQHRPYLDGQPIGCVALAAGGQAAASTVITLRVIAHALRGWPTPLGIALPESNSAMGTSGRPADAHVRRQFATMFDQVMALAEVHVRQRKHDGVPPETQLRAPDAAMVAQ
jgi:NAD(P)H-dependent FMN reductase